MKISGPSGYLAGVDRIRFKRMATPGDSLLITTEFTAIKGNIGKGKGQIKINEEMVCGGEFLFALG